MTAPTGDPVIAELKKITAQLVKQNQTQEKLLKSVQNLEYLVNGYTSGGASFNGYLPDSFLTAYISILGPALSQKMAVGESDLEEMMKGATIWLSACSRSLLLTGVNKRAPMSSEKLCHF